MNLPGDSKYPVGRMPKVDPWIDPQAASGGSWRRDHTSPVFNPVQPLRRLVVVVSEEVLADNNDQRTALLLGLLQDPTVTLLRYGDEGPPVEVERRVVAHMGEVADGWLIADGTSDPYGGTVVYTDGDRVTRSAIGSSEIVRFASVDGGHLYASAGLEESQARAGRDALCAVAAEAAGADLLITRRPLALDPPFRLARGPLAVLTPDDALPIVGLYLRRQGAFVVWRSIDGKGTQRFNRGLFYLVAARDQLPNGWRWMSSCVYAEALRGDQTLSWLGTSLLNRVSRSLEARDHLHSALLQPQDNDVANEALMFLDMILVSLMGAFDAAARVAHRVLALPEEDAYEAGWQRRSWSRKWAAVAPSLANFMTRDGDPQAVLKVLRLLRNSVHGEALTPLAISMTSPKRRDDTLIGLPRREREELEGALAQLGGLESWGIRELFSDRLHADPRVLVERLLPAALAVLNGILNRTPVERLPIADEVPILDGPPPDLAHFKPKVRQAIRWQLGLDDLVSAPAIVARSDP